MYCKSDVRLVKGSQVTFWHDFVIHPIKINLIICREISEIAILDKVIKIPIMIIVPPIYSNLQGGREVQKDSRSGDRYC